MNAFKILMYLSVCNNKIKESFIFFNKNGITFLNTFKNNETM